MIPAITEVNFPSYATLHQATVSLQEMGERTITTQVRIDGSVTPSFEGWELRFKGERFVLPTRTPQAAKDNTTKNALVDLAFQSWAIEQLKHYFFVSLSEYETGKFIPDQYNASVILPLESFVQLFNRVLQYYFGTGIRMDLFGAGTGIYSTQPVSVEINKTYIWDVLIKFYELFGVRWYIEYEQATGAYVIKVGYAADAITDHDFEYGYKGGLLKFERNVQDADVRNILLGRGGEKNLPYRYFKLQDPQNQEWAADPDAIPELASIYFDRLRDINFRWYVRGWMQNPHRDTSWDATHTFPQYTESQCPAEHLFAFRLGKTDAKFNPVEYVKDDASITKYGERWGAVEDNDEVFPTIQGMTGTGIGRVDECVDVSDIVTDDIEAAVTEAATVRPVAGEITITKDFSANEQKTDVLRSEQFTIPSGSTGNLSAPWLNPVAQDGAGLALVSVNTTLSSVKAVRVDNGTEYDIDTPGGFPAGTYYAKITVVIKNYNTSSGYSNVTYGLQSLDLTVSTPNTEAWKPTFDIWVKNIWETTQGQSETDEQYAARVWEPILGDRVGNEAKLVFSDGFMSVSQDYEFTIASYPVKDRSKSINGVQSEWKITLFKSDAEFKATGLYVPNATTGGKPAAGDHFFFIGIDMPFLYVTKAEELLNGATMTPVVNKTAALSDLADVQPTWVISLDKVRVHTLEDGEYGQTLAERLSAGATVRIKDSRFTGGQTLTLYVKSITYTWNEPTTGNPYLVPDIEVVLSDTVLSAEGTVTRVANELNVVKTTYAKSADIESTVRAVGNALFLKKTGESDRSSSPTQFASKVTSLSFRQGDIGGKGWGFYDEEPAKVQAATRATRAAATEAEEKGNSVLEIDKLVVRKEMRVNSLVANQIAYVGGRQIVSAAAIECTQVVDDQAGYYCYFNQKQGTVANLFVVGDFAMGQMFDPNNLEVRYYKARVDEIGSNYILLSKTVKDGDGVPAVGDTIVQHGHESNTDRQFVIVRDVIGGGYERMLSGLDAVDAEGDEYYFAGRLASQGPRWFVGDAAGEYAEWVNGRLNIKGTLVVRNSDGTYQAMTDYMSSVDLAMQQMQAQIDGQIQSWSSGEAETPQTEPFPQVVDDVVDPSTANFPAEDWTLDTDREKHVGDIYVDDSTGQGHRYTKRLKNGVTEYYWTRITDEEVAEAMRLAQQANQGVAGLQYLKAATNNGATLVDGGLILSNLMALGQTVSQQFQVTAGINGIMNAGRTRLGGGLAAWFGGDISDKDDLDQGVTAYAKSVFRFDGSGYLAGGNIHWDQNGYGGIPGITWSGNNIIIGGNVKLASLTGDSVTDLINLVQELSGLLEKVNIGTEANPIYAVHVKDGMGLYSDGFITAGGVGSGSGGGGGMDIDRMWQSLTNSPADPGYENTKIAVAHIPDLAMSKITGLSTALAGKADASALSAYALTSSLGSMAYASTGDYLPKTGGTMSNTNIVTNLNADLLDGLHLSDILASSLTIDIVSDLNLAGVCRFFTTSDSGSSHRPSGSGNSWFSGFTTYISNTNYGHQVALGLDGTYRHLYFRVKNENSWVNWITVYDSTNANSNSVPWSASSLSLSGSISGVTSISMSSNISGATDIDSILFFDTNNTGAHFVNKKFGSSSNPNEHPALGYLDVGTIGLCTYNNSYGLYAWTSYQTGNSYLQTGRTGGLYPTTTYNIVLEPLGGNVGIGTVPSSSYRLDVSGSLNATTIYQNGATLSNTYLALSGGTMSNANLIANLNADVLDGYHLNDILASSLTLQGISDFNSASVCRFFGTTDTGTSHGPSGITSWFSGFTTYVSNTNFKQQLAIGLDSVHIYFRRQMGGTWGDWVTVYDNTNANLTSVPWSASSLTLAGGISGLTSLTFSSVYACSFDYNGNIKLNSLIGTYWHVDTNDGTNALTVHSNSNVGIGNTNPSYKLDVLGTLRATGDATFSANALVSGKFYLSTTSYLESANSGIHANVGFYSDSYITAGASASSSDAKLKAKIRDLEDPMWLIKRLRPRQWEWNSYSTVQGHALGFVAQEVEPFMPFSVGSIADKHFGTHKTLGYDMFHALWCAGLQKHETQLEALEREVKRQGREIIALQRENAELKARITNN